MAWLEIRDAVKEMLADAGYDVRESKGVSRTLERYVVIVSNDENNLDTNNYVGVCQYRNERNFSLWVYNKINEKTTDLDLVRIRSIEAYEEILQDFKKIFNSTYNKIGDAGGIILRYLGMRFIDVPVNGICSLARMEVNYRVQFIEDRHLTQ